MKHVLLICLLALLCGCSSDRGSDAGGNDGVSFNLRIVTRSGSAVATGQEVKLNSLRLLVYDDQDALEVSHSLTSAEFNEPDPGSGVYQVDCELQMMPGNKTFCLVGNEETLPANALTDDQVETLAKLDDVLLTQIPAKGNVLPFTCRTPYTVVWGRNWINLSLRRAVARVDLRLWKAAGESTDVKLTSVKVLNQPVKSSLMEDNPLAKADAGVTSDYAKIDYSPVKTIVTKPATADAQNAAEQVLASFYLFEYTPATGDDSTSLKLTFTVAGVENTATIPLAGAKKENGDYIYSIRRNTLTDLRLMYEKTGMQLTYTVIDWDDTTDPYDKELGEDDSNWWYADWIEVEEYDKELEGSSL